MTEIKHEAGEVVWRYVGDNCWACAGDHLLLISGDDPNLPGHRHACPACEELATLRADKAILDWVDKTKPRVGYVWGGPERCQTVVGRDVMTSGADIRIACASAMTLISDTDEEDS